MPGKVGEDEVQSSLDPGRGWVGRPGRLCEGVRVFTWGIHDRLTCGGQWSQTCVVEKGIQGGKVRDKARKRWELGDQLGGSVRAAEWEVGSMDSKFLGSRLSRTW